MTGRATRALRWLAVNFAWTMLAVLLLAGWIGAGLYGTWQATR